MFLYLVHHGDAVAADVDAQRPLSPRGRENAERLAREAAARDVKPAAIWHSGKLRARQTAELCWRICNPLAELTAVRGLQPSDPPAWIVGQIAGATRDLMLVGHLPNIGSVLARLRGEANAHFPQHGLVALEGGAERWVERWRLGEGGSGV